MRKNPTKRKSAKPRTPAQRAATARMLAANKKRRATSGKLRHSATNIFTTKRTSAQKAARKRKNTVAGYYPNPSSSERALRRWGKGHGKYVVSHESPSESGQFLELARFHSKAEAAKYGQAYATAENRRVKVTTEK